MKLRLRLLTLNLIQPVALLLLLILQLAFKLLAAGLILVLEQSQILLLELPELLEPGAVLSGPFALRLGTLNLRS